MSCNKVCKNVSLLLHFFANAAEEAPRNRNIFFVRIFITNDSPILVLYYVSQNVDTHNKNAMSRKLYAWCFEGKNLIEMTYVQEHIGV